MRDEIFDRTYQAGRAELNAGLDRAFNRVGDTIGKSLAACTGSVERALERQFQN